MFPDEDRLEYLRGRSNLGIYLIILLDSWNLGILESSTKNYASKSPY